MNLFLNNIVIYKKELKIEIPVSDITCLIFENSKCFISARTITKLSENKVLVIFCDQNVFPSCMIQSFDGHHLQLERLRNQIAWSNEQKRQVWKRIISGKINNQIDILKINNKSLKKTELMYSYISQIEPGDPTNREAHAAKVYFNELFGTSFSRSEDSYVNSALNFGYSIIRSAVARAIVSKGLNPTIAIFHSNKYNAFALADDLMEPFRPIVDHYVFLHLLNRDYLSKNEKIELINLLNCEVTFFEKRMVLSIAIENYIDNVIDVFNHNHYDIYEWPFVSSVRYYEL